MAEVIIPYEPRPLQLAIHEAMDSKRFAVAVCHRRFGKSVLAVNQLLKCAVSSKLTRPRYAYLGPTYRQAKQTAWDYILHYSVPIPGRSVNVSELRADFEHNGSQVRIYGADNPDSLRGLYLDGVVLDEFGLMPPNIWGEVLRPALADRQGWALFIGTPAGKNAFYDLIYGDNKDWPGAKNHPDWHFAEYKASQTGYLRPEELAAARKDMTADEYEQEFECSFEAAVKGAVFAKELEQARQDKRITSVPYDPALPVDTTWDLGVGDAMAIWFSQSTRGGEVRLIDYHEASGEGFPYYAKVLSSKAYSYGKHWAPHDIAVRELGSGRSRQEVAAAAGIRFERTPRLHDSVQGEVEEGIHAARMLFARCWFDEVKCKAGLEALQHYRRDYNSRLREFKATPVHDWACFTQDTQVLMRFGTHPARKCAIMDLPENGEVLTPCGWKHYEGPRVTRRNARLVEVGFSDGHTVRCTPDHLFATVSGWKSAESLTPGSLIQSCSIPSASTSTARSIVYGLASGISHVVAHVCTGMSGALRSVTSPMVATFTTGMGTRPTMPSRTWSAFQHQCISPSSGSEPSAALLSLLRQGPQQPSGTLLRLVGHGTAATPDAQRDGPSGCGWIGHVPTADELCLCSSASRGTARSTAPRHAKPLRIVRVTQLDERADTCCIHVPDVECFALANGAIVHNSHGADAFRYLAVWYRQPELEREKRRVSMPRDFAWG